eukprot:SAG31_NODE_2170_length_6266_cov_7.557646_1_plen_91_part_00
MPTDWDQLALVPVLNRRELPSLLADETTLSTGLTPLARAYGPSRGHGVEADTAVALGNDSSNPEDWCAVPDSNFGTPELLEIIGGLVSRF